LQRSTVACTSVDAPIPTFIVSPFGMQRLKECVKSEIKTTFQRFGMLKT